MNRSDGFQRENEGAAPPVFVSYATADSKQAFLVCKALERRGIDCWIASRNVAPGENYQESIVRALRDARALVLVFSDAANNSDEIKKELSLASRYHVPVVALRIADVEPSDAFAYELSTRQWIDAFDGWDRSIELLARRIGDLQAAEGGTLNSSAAEVRLRSSSRYRRGFIALGASAMLLLVLVGSWWFLSPPAVAAQTMNVRLTPFQRLSLDLPESMPDAVRDEIIALLMKKAWSAFRLLRLRRRDRHQLMRLPELFAATATAFG